MTKIRANKFLSFLFVFIMVFLSSSFNSFAVTELSETNITIWPDVTGTCYYGQAIGTGFTISGGEVQYNGSVVPGHFEFNNPNATSNPKSNYIAEYKFVPEDETTYSAFVTSTTNADSPQLTISKGIPTLKDEGNPPVASEVEPGATLSSSTISGGTMIDKYSNKVLSVGASKWKWTDSTIVVTESGYYDATFKVMGTYLRFYDTATTKIYVKVKSDVPEIIEYPSIDTLVYNPNITWADINLKGGKAVVSGTENEVLGIFSIKENWKNITPYVGEYVIDVTFTPNDSNIDATDIKVPVTVNKGTVKFVDESGEEIIPEITLPYGFKVGDDLNGYLKEYLNVSASFNYTETEDYGKLIAPGTHEYEVKTSSSDKNFEDTTLKFKVTVNQAELELKVKDVVGGKQIYIEGGDTYHLNGNFDVKYFIDGKEAGTIEGVKFNETFEVKQDKSGVYTYEIVYNEAENDPYKVTKVTVAADDIKLQHSVKINGNEPVVYTYGEKVTVTAPAHEKPYYVFTGWGNSAFAPAEDDGEVVDTITFSMPDEDVELEATYEFSIKAFFEYIFSLIVDFFAKIAEFLQLQKVCDFFAGIFAV